MWIELRQILLARVLPDTCTNAHWRAQSGTEAAVEITYLCVYTRK